MACSIFVVWAFIQAAGGVRSRTQNGKVLSHGQLLGHLGEADPCQSGDEVERGKCLRDESLGAFAKGLRESGCKEKQQKLSEESEELCQAAETFDATNEATIEALGQALQKVRDKLQKAHPLVMEKLIDHNGYAKEVAGLFHIKLGENAKDALPIVGETLELVSNMAKKELTNRDAAVFALKGLQLAVRLAGPLIPIPGLACLADKVIGFAINKLAAEAEASLEKQQTTAETVHGALTVQKLREAKIFLDAADGQINFQTAIDDSFSRAGQLQNEELSFNRWLILENALAQAIPLVLVPDKADSGRLLKVEERANFMTVIFDHFLVYILVLSRLEDRATQNPVLRTRLVKRAHEMGKLVMPNLAVMWEKQWDNPAVDEISNNWNQHVSFLDTPTTDRWIEFQQKYQLYESDMLSRTGAKYEAKNTESTEQDTFMDRLAMLLANRIYHPKELFVPDWCYDPKRPSVANFIVKCLWHPLYPSPFVQTVHYDNILLMNQMDSTMWSFKPHHNTAESFSFSVQNCDGFTGGGIRCPSEMSENLEPLTPLTCNPGEVITKLQLRVDKAWYGWKAAAKVHCSKMEGFHLVDNTIYTFDMSEVEASGEHVSLNLQSLCAHDYAVLLKVDFKSEAMVSTCQYIAPS